jgi:hypothetical protein
MRRRGLVLAAAMEMMHREATGFGMTMIDRIIENHKKIP